MAHVILRYNQHILAVEEAGKPVIPGGVLGNAVNNLHHGSDPPFRLQRMQ